MENLHIEAGEYTPEIFFDTDVDVFQIEGDSLLSDPTRFYQPVIEWLHDFLSSPYIFSKTRFNFKLNYFNISSTKQIAKLLHTIKNSPAKNDVAINWFYDEEDFDMLEAGQRYEYIMQLQFDFLEN